LYGGNTDLEGLAIGFDTNGDGVFDAQDEKFGEFVVWQDGNQNGASDAGEVSSLVAWSIASIDLVSDGVQRNPADGVFEAGRSIATTTDGQTILLADAAFDFREATVDGLVSVLRVSQDFVGDDLAAPSWADVLAVMPSNGVEQLMLGAETSSGDWLSMDSNFADHDVNIGTLYVQSADSTSALVDENLLNAGRLM
jgi:hypothetical protein